MKILVDQWRSHQFLFNRFTVLDKDNKLKEFFIQTPNSCLDDIHKGKIIGDEKDFFYVDIGRDEAGILKKSGVKTASLTHGQDVLVQVRREELHDISHFVNGGKAKGVKLSRTIYLANKLWKGCIVPTLQGGYDLEIFRRSAEAEETEINQSEGALRNQFHELFISYSQAQSPSLLQKGMNPLQRLLRDESEDITEVIFEHPSLAAPYPVSPLFRIASQKELPLLEEFGVLDEWDSLFEAIVPLPKGGNILIEKTAALTSIDVNKESAHSKEALNERACAAIIKNLFLRKIGGYVVIDFAGIDNSKSRTKLLSKIQDQIAYYYKDKEVEILGWSKTGWLELKLPNRHDPLGVMLGMPCHHCQGTGLEFMT